MMCTQPAVDHVVVGAALTDAEAARSFFFPSLMVARPWATVVLLCELSPLMTWLVPT